MLAIDPPPNLPVKFLTTALSDKPKLVRNTATNLVWDVAPSLLPNTGPAD
ncbi:MAG: hypothetical protein JWO95_2061 [Verrucomicrobiales bacterium]|nr:hypothetical protein [Verrucomicrobiales bacterium]